MREQYGKQMGTKYGKLYRLTNGQAETVVRLLYDKVGKLQDDESKADNRKHLLQVRNYQLKIRRLIAIFEREQFSNEAEDRVIE